MKLSIRYHCKLTVESYADLAVLPFSLMYYACVSFVYSFEKMETSSAGVFFLLFSLWFDF